jgi:hypothetical protein
MVTIFVGPAQCTVHSVHQFFSSATRRRAEIVLMLARWQWAVVLLVGVAVGFVRHGMLSIACRVELDVRGGQASPGP